MTAYSVVQKTRIPTRRTRQSDRRFVPNAQIFNIGTKAAPLALTASTNVAWGKAYTMHMEHYHALATAKDSARDVHQESTKHSTTKVALSAAEAKRSTLTVLAVSGVIFLSKWRLALTLATLTKNLTAKVFATLQFVLKGIFQV